MIRSDLLKQARECCDNEMAKKKQKYVDEKDLTYFCFCNILGFEAEGHIFIDISKRLYYYDLQKTNICS